MSPAYAKHATLLSQIVTPPLIKLVQFVKIGVMPILKSNIDSGHTCLTPFFIGIDLVVTFPQMK